MIELASYKGSKPSSSPKGPETSMKENEFEEIDQSDTQFIPPEQTESSSQINPKALAVDSNTQFFYCLNFQMRYQESLYFKDEGLSTDFKENMGFFHIIFSLILLNKLGLTIYSFFIQPENWVVSTVNLIFASLLIVAQGLVYLLVVLKSKFQHKVFVLYGILTLSSIVFIGISDSEMIFTENEGEFKSYKQNSLAILLIILASRDLFYNHPIFVKIQGLSGILVQFLVYVVTIKVSFIHFVSTSLLFVAGVIYLILYSFRLDFKQKTNFSKLDNQKQASEKLAKSRIFDENIFSSDREKMLQICEILSFLLNQIHSLDLVTQMKTEIKKSLEQITYLKDYIVELPVMPKQEISMMLFKKSPAMSRLDSLNNQQRSPVLPDHPTRVIPEKNFKIFQRNFSKEWNFDVTSSKLPNLFKIASEVSLQRLKIIEKLQNSHKFLNLVESIETNYLPNPFHNFFHAVDVLHSFLFLLIKASNEKLDEIDSLSSIVAALGHDIRHPGKDNLYLTEENHELCSLYNFKSVLENMHCALIFDQIRQDSCNFLIDLSKEDQKHFRENLIYFVLGTDFSTYSDTAGKLRCFVKHKKMDDFFRDEKARFVFSVALKCGDVGFYAKNLELYAKWDNLLLDEYKKLEQRDDFDFVMNEAEFISNNREFVSHSVIPLYKSWNQFLSLKESNIDGLLGNIENNIKNKPYFDSQRFSTTEHINFS